MDTIPDSGESTHSDSELQSQLLDTSEPEVPISTLPSELICEIFSWTLLEKNDLPVPTSAKLKGSPWILGHICRQWRALALAYPALWSSITVLVRESTSRVCAIPILKAQLRRSGDSLLDVVIIGDGSYTPGNFWAQYLAQFETVSLKELDVGQLCFHGANPSDTFLNAPSLSKVVLTSSYWTPNFILPWAQLTEYTASFTPLDHFGHLGAVPNLVNCEITVQTHHRYPRRLHDYPQSGQTVTLHALRRLVVNDDKFLDCLVTPALEELYLIGACDAVQPFLDRSSCVLTRLTLYMCDSHDIIIPLLHSIPSLSTLQIDFFGGAEEMSSLISALTIDPDSGTPCLCPNLTSISWTSRKCVFSHSAFADLVQSRWRVSHTAHCRRLRSIEILLGRVRIFTAGTSVGRLEALRNEGLKVSIQNRHRVPAAIAKWREW
ncbi:hypothetical protein C8J57DRAFT_1705355 [Mycena rebaudengoi]|nr:hypothetical protein C8J57DRAFT_1705355 [Mycena rebaudengoi]